MDDEIVFTQHALRKLQQRGIPKSFVFRTVTAPQKVINYLGKFSAFHTFGKLYLKVVFVRKEKKVVIITQYFVDAL